MFWYVRKHWLIILPVLFLILGGIAFLGSSSQAQGKKFWSEKPGEEILAPMPPSFSVLVEKLQPAVVNISTTQVVKERGRFFHFPSPFGERRPSPQDPFEEFFRRFFGDIPEREFKRQSLGSGFIISPDGYIVTNNHVVENASEIKVILSNEEEYDAEVVGRDPKTDLALIKINAKNSLPVVPLGDSDKLKIGDWVIAIGNPFGLSHTVTAGIVSAKGRVIGAGPYDDFIQTDASINPGNSGGPLFNTRGEVVGINTAIIATGQGIGFAIPINMAKQILPQLREKGKVTRGWLGVQIQRITPELAKSFGLESERGALVADVIEGTPAEKAGLQRGDIIIEFDHKPIKEMNDLPRIVANTPPGKRVPIKVLRRGKEKTLYATIAEMEEERIASRETTEESLGLTTQELTPDIAKSLGLSDDNGVVITDVEPGSPADEANLRRGDVILEINQHPIKTMEDYKRMLDQIKKGDTVLFLVRRGNNTFYTAVKTG
ncbi:MAG: DegQ family serine endoprotease [Nitrospinota bacterium]|nr:MAG: DegQ family serine endoprotease [Nitrospinota bacterium]